MVKLWKELLFVIYLKKNKSEILILLAKHIYLRAKKSNKSLESEQSILFPYRNTDRFYFKTLSEMIQLS